MRLDWLIARPIAHRGLHDAAAGIIENTPGAAEAAIARNYGIECDVQITADGEAMVYHDDALGRLTEGSGTLMTMTAAALKAVPFGATADRMLTLAEFCDLIAGRVPLIVEMKSRFDGDLRIALQVARVLAGYAGPVAAMSFDPDLVMALRAAAPDLVRGIVAERRYHHAEWDFLTPHRKRGLAFLLHSASVRPQFVAYRVDDLPSPGPTIARKVFGLPLLTWTVRTAADQTRARQYADQMIFEGFFA